MPSSFPEALVVAGDVNPPRRLRLIGIAAVRLGLRNVVPMVADGSRDPVREPFVRAGCSVDAPCTGLGSAAAAS